MLLDLLKDHRLILGSASPRRKELLQKMGLSFELMPLHVEEVFPKSLKAEAIPRYLSQLKADSFADQLREKEILITADTIVWHAGRLLEKPGSPETARRMLASLSDDWHEVITAVCCTTAQGQRCKHETTLVKFRKLDKDEIDYYVDAFKPFDKAGGYGIQEWIGLVGIEEISGSYTNVVGLPTASLYQLLSAMVS